MKRIFALTLAVVMCLLLVACGNDLDGTFWENKTMMPGGGSSFNYSLSFEDGNVKVNTPYNDQTFSYEITDDNTMVVDGEETYTFETDGDTLKFNKPFVGTKTTWYR